MELSQIIAEGSAPNDHGSSAELIEIKNGDLASSTASTASGTLEQAQRSLTDVQLLLTEVRGAILSPSTSALLNNPHLQARRELKARQKRNAYFGEALFSDPAWDILLLLCSETEERESVFIKEISVCAGVPGTTTLRWLLVLELNGLVWRRGNEHDRRAVNVGLTARGKELMASYFADRVECC